MEELDKEIQPSDVSLALEREKDDFSGSQKRKYMELDMYLEGNDQLRTSEEVRSDLKNQVIYSEKFYMVLFRDEPTDRKDFEKVFNVNGACPISNKEEQESEHQDEEDDGTDYWSFETEREKRGKKEEQSEIVKRVEQHSESKSCTLKACKPAGQEEEVVTTEWYASESLYQEYCEMSKVYGARIIKFHELAYGKPQIVLLWLWAYGSNMERSSLAEETAAQLYEKYKEEDCLHGMPKSEAIKLINVAMWAQRNEAMHLYRSVEKLLSIVPCITIKTDGKSKHFGKSCLSLGIFDDRRPYDNLYLYLQPIFEAMEPIFHPLIRKENIKEIGWLTKRDFRIEQRKRTQSSKRILKPRDEKSIKCLNEKLSSEPYQNAIKIVRLHQDFDLHLALCSHINEKSKVKDLIADENVVPSRYWTIDESLIRASLKLRVRLLRKLSEYRLYVTWMEPFLKLKATMVHTMLGRVLKAVREIHPDFPNLPEDYILDEKHEEFSSFCDLLSEIKRFLNFPVSYCYLIEGIKVYLDCHGVRTIDMRQKKLDTWRGDCMTRLRFLKRVWGRRHYEDHAYTILFDDK